MNESRFWIPPSWRSDSSVAPRFFVSGTVLLPSVPRSLTSGSDFCSDGPIVSVAVPSEVSAEVETSVKSGVPVTNVLSDEAERDRSSITGRNAS